MQMMLITIELTCQFNNALSAIADKAFGHIRVIFTFYIDIISKSPKHDWYENKMHKKLCRNEKKMNNMKMAVRYFTKTGNTKKLADQMAATLKCEVADIEKPVKEATDVLFLGASIYYAGIDKQMKEYLRSLDSTLIKKVVIFGTSAIKGSSYNEMKKILDSKNIKVDDNYFYCPGEFTVLHKSRPNAEDLKAVSVFAGKYLK